VKTEPASADNTINLSEKTIKGLLWGGAAGAAPIPR